MAFLEDVVLKAWNRSGGKCECERKSHKNHYNDQGRCGRNLIFKNRGREGTGAWEAHHINANGGDILSNCQIICWQCHKQTF